GLVLAILVGLLDGEAVGAFVLGVAVREGQRAALVVAELLGLFLIRFIHRRSFVENRCSTGAIISHDSNLRDAGGTCAFERHPGMADLPSQAPPTATVVECRPITICSSKSFTPR